MIAQVYPEQMEIRKGSHRIFSVRLHFVFVTRYRTKVITAQMLERLREMSWQVCQTNFCAILPHSATLRVGTVALSFNLGYLLFIRF